MFRCMQKVNVLSGLKARNDLVILPASCLYLNHQSNQQHNRKNYKSRPNDSQFGKWFMLIIPISGFGLGTWQVYRKKWKLGLIKQLEERTSSFPRPFPQDIGELKDLEYYPLYVTGTFDHSKEIYIEPRSLVTKGAGIDAGSLMSSQNKNIGMQVITPFRLADSDMTILVNRGFVPLANKNPVTRPQGQVEGVVQVTGLLRRNENRPPLSPSNMPKQGRWLYKDLNEMSKLTGTSPILIDAVFDPGAPPGAPIGGQTRVTLRDEHLSYIVTWYGLSIATSIMWYYRFMK
uniref:SURF1-like protein n=1 Tax=Phallusia mammillata TaxID=59560 RepID=A0A6F9DTF0_9ASCI|nr:surfeit locus protein 1-like [Phallusia mammillata]